MVSQRRHAVKIYMVHRVHDLDGNVIAECHASGYLMTEYVWLEDRPIAVIADAGSTPRTLWVHTDHLERPFLMTNAAGNVVWEASYKRFGGCGVHHGRRDA